MTKCFALIKCVHDLAPCSERVAYVAAVGFLSRYLNGPLPYV